jgi:hypothetical protein
MMSTIDDAHPPFADAGENLAASNGSEPKKWVVGHGPEN